MEPASSLEEPVRSHVGPSSAMAVAADLVVKCSFPNQLHPVTTAFQAFEGSISRLSAVLQLVQGLFVQPAALAAAPPQRAIVLPDA